MASLEGVLDKIRAATRGTEYAGRLFIVGGYVRDKILGRTPNEDVDLVLDGDALAVARLLRDKGVSEIEPVVYPRFGTALCIVDGLEVELVTARAESYDPDSRKPSVERASLTEDALRRDFTINTLMENLHTGERLDLLGSGEDDIKKGIIRTPTDPEVTFSDDPLRMLRAVRLAAVLGFEIEAECSRAIVDQAERLRIISQERIQEEFVKIVRAPRAAEGLNMLLESGVLDRFLPELAAMKGVTQNEFHRFDVWDHTIEALSNAPADLGLAGRLGILFHDVGKPATRTEGDDGFVHFYRHEEIGAEMARKALRRLRFSGDTVEAVARITELHMRTGNYTSEWGDAAVRRLIRDAGDLLSDLMAVYEADRQATTMTLAGADLEELRARIESIERAQDVMALEAPLDGGEIMELLRIGPGPEVGEVKAFLLNEVIEGNLGEGDKEKAMELVARRWGQAGKA
jgi:poly(A) polymerase